MAMVPTLFFYQLGLVALVWVFLMLYWLWPLGPTARRQPIATVKPPRRKRSNAPTAFAGLTTTLPRALCKREAVFPQGPPVNWRISLGSHPILVMSGEVWYLSYFNTEQTRTAMP